jgi:hypothetical protein
MLRQLALRLVCADAGSARGAFAQGAGRSERAPSGKLLTTCIRSARITHNYVVKETTIVKKRVAEAP